MNTKFRVMVLILLGTKPESAAPEADAFTTKIFELLSALTCVVTEVCLVKIEEIFVELEPFLDLKSCGTAIPCYLNAVIF